MRYHRCVHYLAAVAVLTSLACFGQTGGPKCLAPLRSSRDVTTTVEAMSAGERIDCIDQLLDALTLEPVFTNQTYNDAVASARYPPGLDDRLTLNREAAETIVVLAFDWFIEDPRTLAPLIRCVDHPDPAVASSCTKALRSLTRHSYGINVPEFQPTEDACRRRSADWNEWREQTAGGHPILDRPLATLIARAIQQLHERLCQDPQMSGVCGYFQHQADKITIERLGPGENETLFQFGVSRYVIDNSWPADQPDSLSILVYRPGIPSPRGEFEAPDKSQYQFGLAPSVLEANIYKEAFPMLDLAIDIAIGTADNTIRDRALAAIKYALRDLRAANQNPSRL